MDVALPGEMKSGKVYLIGAGPGDPGLMTLKAVRALGLADVILIDELVTRGALAHARSDARVIEVGKRGGCTSTPQEFIERLMIMHARQGEVVARLKGGDPFVFGRGGEEMQALMTAGIDVEVIPGITAGLGVPATLGIPVTHRGLARGVTFVTAHTRDGAEPDWPALVRTATTLVIYMGVSRLAHIVERLSDAGMSPAMPACVVEDGTLATQRQVIGTLATIATDVAAMRIASPAIIVIGEVVRFAQASSGSVPELRVA
jgi:uroporphyrin-III C-methyltransferase